jgi:hypothetical protein
MKLPSGSSSGPNLAGAMEKRAEVRRAAKGSVQIRLQAPRVEIQGELVDLSPSGFRMRHNYPALAAGEFVDFAHREASGRARVVWTRVLAGKTESGFVVAE